MFLTNNTTSLVSMTMKGLTGASVVVGFRSIIRPDRFNINNFTYVQNVRLLTQVVRVQIDSNLHSAEINLFLQMTLHKLTLTYVHTLAGVSEMVLFYLLL